MNQVDEDNPPKVTVGFLIFETAYFDKSKCLQAISLSSFDNDMPPENEFYHFETIKTGYAHTKKVDLDGLACFGKTYTEGELQYIGSIEN